MSKYVSILVTFILLVFTASANATFTAGMAGKAKFDAMSSAYKGTHVIKMALVQTGANSAINTGTSLFSSIKEFGDPANCTGSGTSYLGAMACCTGAGAGATCSTTMNGYTGGGNTLSSCTVVQTTVSAGVTYAADLNCTGNLLWTATNSEGIKSDGAVLYEANTGHIMGLYGFTAASATGAGATFTITPPTVSTSVRGMLYLQ